MKARTYANMTSKIKDLSNVSIKELIPLPTPWKSIEDIIPWGIARTNKLKTDIAVAMSEAIPALEAEYENIDAI